MDYRAMVREAWNLTRRSRFLWAFGLFAGGAVVAAVDPDRRRSEGGL
jgi:hypothetical protein